MPHQILVGKLKARGITDGIIDWIEKNWQKCCSRWGGFKLEIVLSGVPE